MGFWFVIGILILPVIIYYTVRAAVEEGTYKELIKYGEYKKQDTMQDN